MKKKKKKDKKKGRGGGGSIQKDPGCNKTGGGIYIGPRYIVIQIFMYIFEV